MVVILNVLQSGLRQCIAVQRDRRGISSPPQLQAQVLNRPGRASSTALSSAQRSVLSGPSAVTSVEDLRGIGKIFRDLD